MRLKILGALILWVGYAGCVLGREGPTTTLELIQGVIARSEAIFSGEINYRQKSGFSTSNKPIPSPECKAIFSGSSWRLYSKYLTAEIVSYSPNLKRKGAAPQLAEFIECIEQSHRGKSVKFDGTPQDDGSIRYTARIINEKPIGTLSNTYNGPPIFAGSLWFDCTKRFIQRYKDKAERRPDAEVNGVKTQVLEWPVSEAEKFNAFRSIDNALAHGGLLRLYVSSELGFVLPRIEHVSADGTIAAVFDSSAFAERAPGIHIPRHCALQYYISRTPGFRVAYEITEAKRINESIADSEFVVQLPIGTHVADSRNGKSSILFDIERGSPIPDDLADAIAVQSPPFWGRNWPTGLIVGIGGACLLLAITVLARRYLPWRRQP